MEKDNDIPESKILDIEYYLDSHKGEIVDFMEEKISKSMNKKVKITGNIYDRLVNQLSKEMPFGTMIQFALANALIHSLWCGLLSQRMINRKEPKFKDEHVEQLQRAIFKAYDTGRRCASERP